MSQDKQQVQKALNYLQNVTVQSMNQLAVQACTGLQKLSPYLISAEKDIENMENQSTERFSGKYQNRKVKALQMNRRIQAKLDRLKYEIITQLKKVTVEKLQNVKEAAHKIKTLRFKVNQLEGWKRLILDNAVNFMIKLWTVNDFVTASKPGIEALKTIAQAKSTVHHLAAQGIATIQKKQNQLQEVIKKYQKVDEEIDNLLIKEFAKL